MSESHLTRNCVICQKPFVVKTNNRAHAKYCSKACQRAGGKGKGAGCKLETACLNCGKTFSYYASVQTGKYCSRACKKAHWKKPSADRGFIDLTGQTFGRWTVLGHAGLVRGHHRWHVRCSCAARTERTTTMLSLRSGNSQSCGCIAHEGEPRPDTKTCTKCRGVFPYDEQHFSKHSPFRWGLRPICLTCWGPIARARHCRWRRKIKLEVLSHYSGGKPRCSCCGVDHIEFLTLDHVNNDGKEDRKVRGLGIAFYARLKRDGFPSEPALAVCCFNCNVARSMFGTCPHKRDIESI